MKIRDALTSHSLVPAVRKRHRIPGSLDIGDSFDGDAVPSFDEIRKFPHDLAIFVVVIRGAIRGTSPVPTVRKRHFIGGSLDGSATAAFGLCGRDIHRKHQRALLALA